MKKILAFLLIILNIGMVMCSSNSISSNDISEMKEVVDKVLSYDGSYDAEVEDYIDEDTFELCNYVIFYSYYIGKVKLTNYESELKGVSKEGSKYNLCMVINMEAQATTLESDEEGEGYDTAEGIDVPVEVVLVKKNGKIFIESVKEYESLQIAQNENKNFIENE